MEEYNMKKVFLFFLAAVIFTGSIFAGGGGYFDDYFPDFSYVMLDESSSKQEHYVLYECEATVKSTGKKVTVPAGTEVKIISMDTEVKFNHDYDVDPFGYDRNLGILYYDYLCSFTVNGQSYTALVPGIFVSTTARSVTVSDGTTYKVLSVHFASSALFYDNLRDANSFEEVNERIRAMMNDSMIVQCTFMNPESYYTLAHRILNTKTKHITDIIIYVSKMLDFPPGDFVSNVSYETFPLPKNVIVIEFQNFRGGFGGGTSEYTWYALNPETGRTYYICQCSYASGDCIDGSHSLYFDQRGAVLNVQEIDEYGKTENTKVYKQHPSCEYIFNDNYSLERVKEEKFVERNLQGYETYYNTENLRLRKTQETSSETILVMAKGCHLTVLEVGKKDTIDGITSNWVKVEVYKGTQKDGKKIPDRTQGWCFGGYLSYY